MTTITINRAVIDQTLETLEKSGCLAFKGIACRCNSVCRSYTTAVALRAALAQQAEPVASLNAWAEARLARHGIQACLYPQCVGGQSGTVCHQHCPTPCTDCRGIGYDSSGQLCGCQQNPSF
jgi:hypothetical protein